MYPPTGFDKHRETDDVQIDRKHPHPSAFPHEPEYLQGERME